MSPPSGPKTAAERTRIAFLTASMAAVSLDFVSNEAAFRTVEERKQMLVNGIRFGNVDQQAGLEKVRVATALVSQFADNGAALARQIFNRYSDEVSKIPAEIVSDQVARMSHREGLFLVARELESAAYSRRFGGFDSLSSDGRSLVAAFLDFCGIARSKFANAFTSSQAKSVTTGGEVSQVFPSVVSSSPRLPASKETDAPLFASSPASRIAASKLGTQKGRRNKRK
jgi:hypothetical protein